MTVARLKPAALWIAVALAIGCSASHGPRCEGASFVASAPTSSYCAYAASAIVIEGGFSCPAGMPHSLPVPGFVICSDGPMSPAEPPGAICSMLGRACSAANPHADSAADAGRPRPVAPRRARPIDPEMVLVAGDESSYLIDATEVTQKQFAEFLGCTSADSCAASADVPCGVGRFDPEATPDHPVMCVSWRAADDYCSEAGKRLCTLDELGRACESTWDRISDGAYNIEHVPDACVLAAWNDGVWGPPSAPAPVGSARECRGAAAPFDRVFDAIGNADEWVAGCDEGSCLLVGGSHTRGPSGHSCDGVLWLDLDPTGQSPDSEFKFAYAGFRCCADAAE